MKTILSFLAAIGFVYAVNSFRKKYQVGIYYIDRHEEQRLQEEEDNRPFDINGMGPENYDNSMDIRGTPTHLCPCGCNIWNVKVVFEDFEIATYFLDMECAKCGNLATAPTLLDREITE